MYVKAKDGSWETPLVEGKECAFALFEENGVVKCSIEKAFNEKKISWQKPISCHLYPVRLNKIGDKIALNYDQWQICSSACKNGKKLKIPIYEFTEKALKRKFGKSWFEKLKLIAKKYQKS